MRIVGFVFVVVLFFFASACEIDFASHHGAYGASSSAATYDAGAAPPPAAACDPTIDPAKELLVVDRSVLASTDPVFGFRARMEELAGDPADAARLTTAWLRAWEATRPGVDAVLLDPWTRAGGDMSDVPFRLIAVVNRADLPPSGELRFVYTAVDAETGAALAMTVIVEIPYADASVASAWHGLGTLSFGEAYTRALASLLHDVVAGADPSRTRVRTNEVALGAPSGLPWELRQFVLAPEGGALVASLLPSTPADGLDGSPALDAWLEDHEPRLSDGVVDELPSSMRGYGASMPERDLRWGLTSPVSERARKAFSAATCNGCHGGERPIDALPFQHLAPSAGYYESAVSTAGDTRVSTYLREDLDRRARVLARQVCAGADAGTAAADPYAATPRSCP